MARRQAARYRWLGGPQCRDRRGRRHKIEETAGADAAQARRRQTGEGIGRAGLESDTVSLKKRSFTLSGHRTSVALEAEFWAVIDASAAKGRLSLAALVAKIDATRGERP